MAVLALCACENNRLEINTPESKTFTATIGESFSSDTKTSLDEHGNVLWKQGDQISIFAASTVNQHYQVTDDSDGKTAAALNQVSAPGFVAGTEIENNVAFYPYSSTASIAKNSGNYVISSITLPATQNYAVNSFGNGAFPMAAVTSSTSDKNLKFKNIVGGLKLQLKGTASIASISVTGNNNEILCGAANVTVSTSNIPSINLTDASAKTVTLDCGTGVALNTSTATSFVIALPPMTMTGGFTVVATDTEGKQMEIKTTKSQTITRSNLLKMPEVTYEGVATGPVYAYVDLGLSVKWATMNVGATTPTDYGDYFAWGATEPLYEPGYAQEDPQSHWKTGKSAGYTYMNTPYQTANTDFSFASYLDTKWTKYVGSTTSEYKDASATDSDALKTVLDASDDAASVNWGGSWRMPTKAELDELCSTDNCTWDWYYSGNSEFDGIAGYKVTSKKSGYTDKFIFLPAAGYREDTDLGRVGSRGYYWSSSLYSSGTCCAYDLGFSNLDNTFYYDRYRGQSIRPVCP